MCANAENVLLTHAPLQKRAQSGEILAALKAKEADTACAADAAPARAAPVPDPRGNAIQMRKAVPISVERLRA